MTSSDASLDANAESQTEDLEDLYENAPCGYLSMKPDGAIVKVNATFCAWTGFGREELLGKKLRDYLSIPGRIFLETHLTPLLRMQGWVNEVALDFNTSGGGRLPVLANAVERRDEAGQAMFVRLTVFPAVERRRFERELVAAKQAALTEKATTEAVATKSLNELRETGELREQFIAVLGHDLRNPLAAISGGVQILSREKERSDRAVSVLGLMQLSVVRMSGLIDNVLDFARGRLGGGFSLNRNALEPLGPVIDHVVAELRATAPDRTILTDFSITEPIDCDRARIGQLVSNLLGNAITHGSKDLPIMIGATTKDDQFKLWVANAGDPIPETAMEKLFQPFFRGDHRPSQQGLGLGLHIALEIARAHGGTLTVTSSDEETRFTFTMPQGELDQ